jgi:hypothetical protein
VTEVKELALRIINPPLRIVQKIHAIKTYALPELDHLLLNADAGLEDLKILDQNIRGAIGQALAVRGIRVECYHCSRRDGGASLASAYHRADVLAIRSLVHMLISPDAAIRAASRKFVEDEFQYKHIGVGPAAPFLDSAHQGSKFIRGAATTIAERGRRACFNLHLDLKIREDCVVIRSGESAYEIKSAAGLGHFLDLKKLTSTRKE